MTAKYANHAKVGGSDGRAAAPSGYQPVTAGNTTFLWEAGNAKSGIKAVQADSSPVKVIQGEFFMRDEDGQRTNGMAGETPGPREVQPRMARIRELIGMAQRWNGTAEFQVIST